MSTDEFGFGFSDLNPVKAVKRAVKSVRKTVKSTASFVSNAAKTAGKGIHSGVHAVSKVSGAVSGAIGHVPIVGPGLHGVYSLTVGGPISLVDSVASGQRIDKAVLNNLKSQVKAIREVAPYAQTIVALVPGVGTGVAGAIGASAALIDGRPITEAVTEGIRGAVPGGVAGKALFDSTRAVMMGKPIEEVGLAALPIPDSSKKPLGTALHITHSIANGKKPDDIIVEELYRQLPAEGKEAVDIARKAGKKNIVEIMVNEAMKPLPPDVKKSIDIGVAVGHATAVQKAAGKELSSEDTLDKLAAVGKNRAERNPVISAARKLALKGVFGFDVGMGLMTHSNVKTRNIITVRNSLKTPDNKRGFDMALSTNIALVTRKAPVNMTVDQKAGFYVTNGMMGAKPGLKAGMMKAVITNAQARDGARIAIIQAANHRKSWWTRLKEYFVAA